MPIIKSLLILGSGQKKEKILEYISISVPILVKSIEIEDPEEIQKYVFEMISEKKVNEEEKYIERIETLIQTNPDILLFGRDDILENIDKIRFLYTSSSENIISKEKIRYVSSESLKKYGDFVGELYHV